MGVGLDSPWHWLILIVVLVALFGARRLPNAAKSLAQSVRIFRSELKSPSTDQSGQTPPTAAAIPPAAPVPATPPPVDSRPADPA